MYRKPLLKTQCKFCGIIGTEKNPVKYGVCSRCRVRSKEFPKEITCFRCGNKEVISFEAWSRRGNCCIPCDIYYTRLVRENGYAITVEGRKTLIEKLMSTPMEELLKEKSRREYSQLSKQDREKYSKAKYSKEYYKIPRVKINGSISSSIRESLKGKKAGRKWESLVGYTIKDLMAHLKNLFDDKMTWDNYGSYWHIDHIKPQSLFKYETAEDPEFKKCWALENLQPLEARENLIKSNHF